MTIDRDRAAVEGRGNGARLVPITIHETFQRKTRYSLAERKELAIKQAALRVVAGLELRSLRAIGKEIGCTHTAIDNAIARLADRCGMKKFYLPASKREQRALRRRALAEIRELSSAESAASKIHTPGKESTCATS